MQKLLNRLSQKSIERVTEETIVRWGYRRTPYARMCVIRSLFKETQLSLTNRATHLCKCKGVVAVLLKTRHVTTPNLVVLRGAPKK